MVGVGVGKQHSTAAHGGRGAAPHVERQIHSRQLNAGSKPPDTDGVDANSSKLKHDSRIPEQEPGDPTGLPCGLQVSVEDRQEILSGVLIFAAQAFQQNIFDARQHVDAGEEIRARAEAHQLVARIGGIRTQE